MVMATNLTSICCVYKEKFVKNDSSEESSVHTNSESNNIRLESLKSIFNSNQIIQKPDFFPTHSFIVDIS